MIGTQTANRMPEREAVAARFEAAVVTGVRGDPRPAHERRVKQLCVAVAERMGLDAALRDRVAIAAMLHDIGKVRFPESVLLKPGPLSSEEWVLMRTHPQVAYEALTSMGVVEPIAAAVRQHHERMNGSGYPLGLRGEAILLEARILAVADVVEAMCADRPYRLAPGLQRALEEIGAGRGRLYDPAAVDACLNLFRVDGFTFESP